MTALHQCLQHALKDKQKQISISNQHFQVPRWSAFNLVQVPFQCMFGMPSESVMKIKVQKMCMQKVQVSNKKKFTPTGIRIPYFMLESQLFYQLCHMCFVVSSGMLLCFFVFKPLQNANWTGGDKLEVSRQRTGWCNGVVDYHFTTEKHWIRPVWLTGNAYLIVWKVSMTRTYANKNEE